MTILNAIGSRQNLSPDDSPTFASLSVTGSLSAGSISGVISKVKQQIFTSSGTYNPTAGMVYCIVEGVGGGGSGGGATSGVGNAGAGGSGGAGEYSRIILTASDIGGSKSVSIGGGGAPQTAGNIPGQGGGNTSLGVLFQAIGGSGGGGAAAGSSGTGGSGGTGGVGDFRFKGQDGSGGLGQGVVTSFGFVGAGGSSFFGGGGQGRAFNANTSGNSGSSYGSGGTGGGSWNGSGNVSGAAGSAGVIIITEFIS